MLITSLAQPDREIAGCITDMGIAFTVSDLQKPDPKQIQRVFEWLAEVLMNATREVVAPAMRAAADDVCSNSNSNNDALTERIFTSDTRDLMGLFVVLRRLLRECGIADFTFQDLFKPTRERLVKIFSYVINFVRFRESQTAVIDEHFNRAERAKLRVEQLFRDNAAAEARLADLQRNRANADAQLRQREKRSAELKQRLLELQRGSERVQDRLDRVKSESARLRGTLQQKTEAAISLRQEAAKLRPYTEQSPAALETDLRDLNNNLASDKARIESLDRRARALQTSTDTFAVVSADVSSCTRLLGELQSDLAKEDEELAKATRHRDALSERSNNVRDVDRQENFLKKHLNKINEKTEKVRGSAEKKAEEARERMDELKGVHRRLTDERVERMREMERRRVKIEQTEKKVYSGRRVLVLVEEIDC